jgi:enoyl reductase
VQAVSDAIVFTEYGDPDVLRLAHGPLPQPGPGQLRVRVKAAGVQPFDCLFRSGAARQWMPASFPQRLGNEFAGVVDALGTGATGLSIGDEVLGWAVQASYAEHVIVGVGQLQPKPPGMPWAEAAVLSASGQTAATAISRLEIGAGETILIHAGAGGVGSFAVQIARSRGATVIATSRPVNHDYLRSLGAIPVTYGEGLADRVRAIAPNGPDAALDAAGTLEATLSSLELVRDRDRIATLAFSPSAGEHGIRRISTERSVEQLRELTDLHVAGALRISIQSAHPLVAAPVAHREIETGHVRGKIVLTVWMEAS